jgi:transposase
MMGKRCGTYISKAKKDYIRRLYITRQVNVRYIAEKLELMPKTVRLYLNEFRLVEEQYPEKLTDYSFFLSKREVILGSPRYLNFLRVIPALTSEEPGPLLIADELYKKYQSRCPGEYSLTRFYNLFKRWFNEHEKELIAARLKTKFTPEELETLERWRKGNDKRLWQVSVALTTVYVYNGLSQLARRIDKSLQTLIVWLKTYEKDGLQALARPGNKRPISQLRRIAIEKRMDEVVYLVRQSPKTYGIDRTSWTLTDLAFVYSQESGRAFSCSQIWLYLRKRGVRFRRTREMIASSDPQFRQKYGAIQAILANLGEKEKFFSIDEYGPRSVRPHGGRMLVIAGKKPEYRKVDKGKGSFICTCALELSTNQLSWFYSSNKDTDEMIRLIGYLIVQYQDQEKLYLCWDAASWHDSRQLHDYLIEINDPVYRARLKTPEILLAPLPARAPHLNVIESVFSGLAKSVIHNSDYESVQECKDAVDRYFNRRNAYYQQNPKKAGQKIWGKERVKPIFDKANICRNV